MKKHIRFLQSGWVSSIVAGAIILGAANVNAQTTPAGLWKTIDDESGKPKALVRVYENNGYFEGRIEKLLDPDDPVNPVCGECRDERRNKPILGMVILRNVKPGTNAGSSLNGEILDPENGNVYRARLTLKEDGRRLEIRGYVGIPLFGRTQTWFKAD